jgi:hypothetical protein
LPLQDGTQNLMKMVDTNFTTMNWARALKDSKEFL